MLDLHPMVAFLATNDSARARAFYEGVLGLEVVSDDAFALVLRGYGTTLRIANVKTVVAPLYTSLGWDVADVEETVSQLAARGVRCQSPG